MKRGQDTIGPTYSRVDLSHYHLYSAFFFKLQAERIEEDVSQCAYTTDVMYQYWSFVVSTVVMSVAFLEAKIAEIRTDSESRSGLSATGLTVAQKKSVADELSTMPSRSGTLERYQAVLRVLGKNPFQADQTPYQPVSLVVKLRNYLIHFPGEWLLVPDDESGRVPQKDLPIIERQLKGQFPSTRFAWSNQPFFPFHCLSAGCAAWAANSCLSFATEFSSRAGVLNKHLEPIIRGV